MREQQMDEKEKMKSLKEMIIMKELEERTIERKEE